VGQSAGLLDDAVDGFGAAVGHTAGGEVGQDLLAPLPQRAAESGDFVDRAGVQGLEELLGELTTRRVGRGVVDRADLLVDLPGEFDLAVGVTGR
jgi:hypothetical protein